MALSYWFTSDVHFGHFNLLTKYCRATRIGDTTDEMDERIILNWQTSVQPDDVVWVLGDVFFCGLERARSILVRLPGEKHLVYGNHDRLIRRNKVLQDCFKSTQEWTELRIDGTKVILHHYPTYSWKDKFHGSYHLYGHIHSRYGEMENPHVPGRAMDVGIDSRPARDMSLWSWREIDSILSKRVVPKGQSKESV